MKRLQPKSAVLCGAALGVLFHRPKPTPQLILNAEHTIRAVFEHLLRRFDRSIFEPQALLLWAFDVPAFVLVQLVVAFHRC